MFVRARLGVGVLALCCLPSCGDASTRSSETASHWEGAQMLGPGYDVHVAVGQSGTAIAVWKTSADTYELGVRRRSGSAGWESLEFLGGPACYFELSPTAHAGAIVAWNERDGSSSVIRARRFAAGTGWVAAQELSTGTSVDHTMDCYSSRPAVALDPIGTAWVAWRQVDGGRHRIWIARSEGAAMWRPAEIAAEAGGNASRVQVAADATGNAFLAWRAFERGVDHIRVVRFTAGAGWGPIETLASEPGVDFSSQPPELAVAGNGEALVLWASHTGRNETGRVWAARFAPKAGWQTAVQIGPTGSATPGESPASLPRVGLDVQGAAVAVWRQWSSAANFYDVWANRFTTSIGWGQATRLSSGSQAASPPALAIHSSGEAIAVWFEGGPPRVRASRFDPAAGWSEEEAIDRNPGDFLQEAPEIGMDEGRNAIVVWWQTRGSSSDFQAWSNRLPAARR